jgi:hypothetical protein
MVDTQRPNSDDSGVPGRAGQYFAIAGLVLGAGSWLVPFLVLSVRLTKSNYIAVGLGMAASLAALVFAVVGRRYTLFRIAGGVLGILSCLFCAFLLFALLWTA